MADNFRRHSMVLVGASALQHQPERKTIDESREQRRLAPEGFRTRHDGCQILLEQFAPLPETSSIFLLELFAVTCRSPEGEMFTGGSEIGEPAFFAPHFRKATSTATVLERASDTDLFVELSREGLHVQF